MAEYRPGTEAAAWIQQVYSKKIHVNAYNKQRVVKNFKSLNDESQEGKPGQTFNWFTHANLTRTALTSTSALTGLTYLANTEANVTGSASALIVPVQVNQLTLNRMMIDPRDTLKASIERSLAEGIDVAGAALAASMVTNLVGSAASVIDKALASQAGAKTALGAKEYWAPGDGNAYLYYHPNQYQYVQNVIDWTAAYARGDTENPNVKGVVTQANGFTFVMSPTVYSAAGTMYNFVQTEYSHGIGYNQKITIDVQKFDAVYKLIGIADFMVMILKDAYGTVVQTTSA